MDSRLAPYQPQRLSAPIDTEGRIVHAPDGRQFRIEPVQHFDDRMARQERERQQAIRTAKQTDMVDFLFRFAVGVVGFMVLSCAGLVFFAVLVNSVRPASNAPTIINPSCKVFC